MKSDRLLSMLLLLQAQGRLTGRELARRLEISIRTVHRDMDALSAAGIPVVALRGAQGGWQLDEGYRTRVPGLDEAELRALLMAQPRVVGDSRLARAAERALDKLMAALPASLREQAASIRQRLHVDATSWDGTPEDLSMLPLVQDAVARDRKLVITYRKPERRALAPDAASGTSKEPRVVDPLGLVAKGSAWYLVAGTAKGLRTFRVSRIVGAKLLDEPAARPRDFDLAAHWQASQEELRKSRSRTVVTLRLEPRVAESIAMWRKTTPAACGDGPRRDGWVALDVHFDDEEQACFMALGLGSRVEIVGPESLRRRATREMRTALDRLSKVDRSGEERGGAGSNRASRAAARRRRALS